MSTAFVDPSDLPFDGAYGWIEAIAQAEHDLSKYPDHWLAADSPNAYRNLALMIIDEGVPNTALPAGGYWSGHIEQWEQVNTWLRHPEMHKKLANGLKRGAIYPSPANSWMRPSFFHPSDGIPGSRAFFGR